MYTRILVPLDGSTAAETILPHAFAIARQFGSTLVLLHAINARAEIVQAAATPEPVASVPVAVEVAEAAVEAEANATDAYLRGVQQRATNEGIACEAVIVEGPAADTVVHAVEEYHIDLVAMTTPGRSTLGRLFFGSTPEDVLAKIAVPVLLLRAEEKD